MTKLINSSKIHRRYSPLFKGKTPQFIAAQRFSSALAKHDWNRNHSLYDLRCKRNQRVSIRSERRETLDALALAIIANTDYNPDSDYLFEVTCSIEELARQTGQLHQYEHGRVTCDPVRHAINDLEQAGLLIVHRAFDETVKKYKATRVWVTELFFNELGFKRDDIRDMLNSFRHWLEKQGLRESYKKKYERFVLELARKNVASINNAHSLKNLLKKIRQAILGSDYKDERNNLIKQAKQRLSSLQSKVEKPARTFYAKYLLWKNGQPVAAWLKLEQEAKQRFTQDNEERYKWLCEQIPI